MRAARLAGLAVVLGLVTAPAALAQPGERFVARLDLELTGGPVSPSRCADPLVLVELGGTGNASGLGAVVADASHCIVDDPADIGVSDGLLTLSGKGGTLMLAYEGTDVAGVLSGTFTIVGGTGAFAGATGGGVFLGIAVRSEDRGFVLMRGRIAVP